MRVLVIGKEGQLARSLANASQQAGIRVQCMGRPELDLLEPASVRRLIDAASPSVVINAAAYTAVDKAEAEPEVSHAINVEGPAAIAAACERNGVPLVHVSTDYVFDGSKASAYVEDDPVAPLGAYGRSKREGEVRVAELCSRHLIVRTAWVVSPFGNNFVKTMLRLAQSRPEVGVVDDQVGNPTFAPHLAVALLEMSRASLAGGKAKWGTYHAVGSGDATWCALAREVFVQSRRHSGPAANVRAITTAEYPTPAKRPANSRLDCGKLRREFGLALPDWKVGIESCVSKLLTTGGVN